MLYIAAAELLYIHLKNKHISDEKLAGKLYGIVSRRYAELQGMCTQRSLQLDD